MRFAQIPPAVLLALFLSLDLPMSAAEPVSSPSTSSTPRAENPAIGDILAAPLDQLEQAYADQTPPEAVRMLIAISRGSHLGPGEGWFGPAQSRYSWNWLAARHGVAADGAIAQADFRGPAAQFTRLDRNRDGRVDAEDLDWSDGNLWVRQAYLVNRLFRRVDAGGDGRLTREKWLKFFDQAAGNKGELHDEDLRDALLAGVSSAFQPGDAPTKDVLIRGLFSGEIGSMNEGPQINDRAPDFSLKTLDGRQTIRLHDVVGAKPVVLVFGNYTCAPFRSMFPGVEEAARRFADEAVFLAIYVREAHPTDGWRMISNERVGVQATQPKTYAERVAVAAQCAARLKPTMPLLVDEINDPTGNAYSGMPARLYVIDCAGQVAYKGGRGPFGFKTGEMEQALVMTLLDRATTGPEPRRE